jgi:hypothetical protein
MHQIISPKGNANTKQKLMSSNKTFSGSAFGAGQMNSPSNKMNGITGFKSPNSKSRYLK